MHETKTYTMENLSKDNYLTDEQFLEVEKIHEKAFYHFTSLESKLIPNAAHEMLSDLRWSVLQKDFRMNTNSINYFNSRREYTAIRDVILDLNKMSGFIFVT